MSYKCENCGATKEDGSEYFRVMIVTSEGGVRYMPTCSEKCGDALKDKYTNLHLQRANTVENQTIQSMIWNK